MNNFSLTKNVSSVFITNSLALLLGIPTAIIIARVLGPQGLGIYTLVLLVPGLLYQIGNLGLAGANTYFIGRKRFSLTDIASNSLVFGFVVSVSLAILFLLAYEFFLHPFFQDVEPSLIYLVLLAVPFSITPVYFQHILLAKFKVKEFNLLRILEPALMLISVVLLLLLLNKGVLSLVWLYISITVITFFLSYLLVNRLTEIKFHLNKNILKESLNFGIKVHLANIFTFLHYRADVFMVSYFIGATHVGFYSISVGIAETVWLISHSVNTILFPVVASSGKSESREVATTLFRHTLFLTLLACLGLAVIGKWAIGIVYGSEFLPSFMPLLILLPGVLAISLSSVISAYLAGIGKPIVATYASLASLGVNVGLNLIFIPKWGISGAAFATSISYSLSFLIRFFVFLKLSGVKPKDILLMKPDDIKFYLRIARKLAHRANLLRKR